MLKKIKENKGWNSDNPCLGFALSHCIVGQSFEFENTKAYEEFIEKNNAKWLKDSYGTPTDSTIRDWQCYRTKAHEFELENSKIYRLKTSEFYKASFTFNDAFKRSGVGVDTIDLYEDGIG